MGNEETVSCNQLEECTPLTVRSLCDIRASGRILIQCLFAPLTALLACNCCMAADITFTIDADNDVHPISPYIYGMNSPTSAELSSHNLTLSRAGGNRWTAFNWENNASNAGSDYFHQNDSYLCTNSDPDCDLPGEAVRRRVATAHNESASALITIPIQGYVAADKNGGGDVAGTPDYLQTRFLENIARKGSLFSLVPDTADDFVFQDEFVAWVETRFPGAHTSGNPQIFYCLDNEPALWPSTHARIHPGKTLYGEMADRSVEFAKAIKNVASEAIIFGPVSYGWAGWENLQEAPDAAERNFFDFYLETFSAQETDFGSRLLDVADVHWYPEAQGKDVLGEDVRITGANTDPAVVEARIQAPRSLWDTTYTEDSWIAQWGTSGPIYLIPRLSSRIEARYPGTKLAISEYFYGAGHHISGGLAQADALGVFGREGLYAATLWPLSSEIDFVMGAFDMFRNYDGLSGSFGDISVSATTDDVERTSVYASLDSSDLDRMVVVAINKTSEDLEAEFSFSAPSQIILAEVHQLSSASSSPRQVADVAGISNNMFSRILPAQSVSTLVLKTRAARAGALPGILPLLTAE